MRSTLRLRFVTAASCRGSGTSAPRSTRSPGPTASAMSAVPLRGDGWDTLADFTVRKGDRVPFVLSWAPGHDPQMPHVDADQALVHD